MSTIPIQDRHVSRSHMVSEAVWFFLHALFALLAWGALMLAITFFRPESVPAALTLGLSFAFPFLVGYLSVRKRPSDVAALTWLAGVIWLMIIGLWVLDMPTGPGECFRCGPADKLWRTFFSLTRDSGMIDGQGRFFGTWPAAAMIGYSIGARLAMRGVKMDEQ